MRASIALLYVIIVILFQFPFDSFNVWSDVESGRCLRGEFIDNIVTFFALGFEFQAALFLQARTTLRLVGIRVFQCHSTCSRSTIRRSSKIEASRTAQVARTDVRASAVDRMGNENSRRTGSYCFISLSVFSKSI